MGHFGDNEILVAINQLKNSGGKRYNVDLVRSEFQKPMKLKKGKWSPVKKINNREVLLIASGPKAKDYKYAIERIYRQYPYDGSEKEKILYELSSSYLDKYVFDKRYPIVDFPDPIMPSKTMFLFNSIILY